VGSLTPHDPVRHLARVRHMIDRWQRVLRWLDLAPERDA
jgi:hypothetical protein